MTVKSNYKLDARIKSMDDVQTCLQYDESYIGERGYFASNLCDLSDLSNCSHDTLAQIILDGAGDDIFRTPHDVDYDNWGSRFFVPERLLKPVEKKYRAFTLAEWVDKHGIGDVVIYRSKKSDGIELHHMYVGYACGIGKNIDEIGVGTLTLGVASYTFDYLFEDFELFYNGRWLPFGVIEDD